jgi:hypothetical protein
MNEIQGQASDYMKSLLDFLSSILESFNHLPVNIFERALKRYDSLFYFRKKRVVLSKILIKKLFFHENNHI